MGSRKSGVSATTGTSIGIDFYYRGTRCRERIKLPPTARNLAYANNLLGQIKTEIAKGTFEYRAHFPDSPRAKLFAPPAGRLDMADLLAAWYQRKQRELEKSTLDGYRKIVDNVLVPAIGKIIVMDLTRQHVVALVDGLGDVSNKRRNNVLGPLRGALDDAVHDGLLAASPLTGLRFKRRAKPREEDDIDPFTPEEVNAFLESCPDPQLSNMLRFWVGAGLRTSEVIALQWADVDLAAGQLRIRRAFVEGEMKAPKTRAGERIVDLLPMAAQALRDQRQHTQLADKEVFQNPLKRQAWEHDQQIRNQFRRLLATANVRYRYPYQLRHTFASLSLSAGENVMWVAKQMGHKDWTVTARKYARWIKDAARDAGNKFSALWAEKSEKLTKH